MISILCYKEIINSYINIYDLSYSKCCDPGIRVYRHCVQNVDIDLRTIDLRIMDKKLFLQFYGYGLIYVFKWNKSEEDFLRIMENDSKKDVEKSIHNFMAGVIDTSKYFGLKYGLK